MTDIALIIPAYNPPDGFAALVDRFMAAGFKRLVVVDDGSDPGYADLFAEIGRRRGVTLLRHAINRGKGAALKTAFNHCCCTWPEQLGAVTADADGQHLPEDALRVAEQLRTRPDHLVLGSRRFSEAVPWRSRVGNRLTRLLFRGLVGTDLQDTQTGLRGVPTAFMTDLLRIRTDGYEFELDMLLTCRKRDVPIHQVPIETVYLDRNRSSHFNPVLDSMRIYFVLFRFSLASASTALIDYTVFLLAIASGGSLAVSQVLARLFALCYNYTVVKRLVFCSDEDHQKTFPKYVALVIVSGLISYQLIGLFQAQFGWRVIPAKILAELLIFFANFAIQRDFIFARRKKGLRATEWTHYYSRPHAASSLTRQWTTDLLCRLISRYVTQAPGGLRVAELGGGGGTFVQAVLAHARPQAYDIYDNNRAGLNAVRQKIGASPVVGLHEADVLALNGTGCYDLVYSVGLVEHFDPAGTQRAVQAHLDLLCPGGVAILTFPTPTWLYRLVRGGAELLGLWRFPDERPLRLDEVRRAIGDRAEERCAMIHWRAILTQAVLVVQKPDA